MPAVVGPVRLWGRRIGTRIDGEFVVCAGPGGVVHTSDPHDPRHLGACLPRGSFVTVLPA